MAWQSGTINPATTSPAADITKITNDLQVLRSVLGGGADTDVPVNFANLAWTGTLTGGTGIINIGSGQIYKDASGNVMIGSTVPGLQSPGRGYLEIAGSSTAMTAYRSAGNMTGYTSGFTTGIEIYGVTDVVMTAGVNTCQRMNNTGAVFFPSIGTTAAAANAFLNSGSSPVNQLLRSTSSIRYKREVEDLDQARAQSAVDGLRPIWYRSKAEADNKAWSWYGLLAEEVAQIEPRLVHWGYTDEAYEEVDVPYQELVKRDTGLRHADGSPVTIEEEVTKYRKERRLKAGAELVPDGVQYERLSVLLLAVVKQQQATIEALDARINALESKA